MDRLLNNKEFKESRLVDEGNPVVNRRTYNLIIALTLAWGLVLDFLMCNTLQEIFLKMNFILMIIIYLAVSFAAVYFIYGSDRPVVSFSAFTVLSLAMGMLLTVIVSGYTGESIGRAFIETIAACLVIGVLSAAFPNVFMKMGRGLFAALVIMILVEIACILVMGYSPQITSIVMIVIFSGYFGYDLVKAQSYVPTVDHAIDSAADIYVDVVNLFIRILRIAGERN